MLVVKCKKVTPFSYPEMLKKFTPSRPEDLWVAELDENDMKTVNKLKEAGINVMTSKRLYHEPYTFFRFRAYNEMETLGEFYILDELSDYCSKEDRIHDFLNKHYEDLMIWDRVDIELHLDIDEPFCHSDPYNHAILRKIVVNVKGVAFS